MKLFCNKVMNEIILTLLQSERPKLYGVLAFLSAVGLNWARGSLNGCEMYLKVPNFGQNPLQIIF